jgi:hypothetical protein
MKTIKTNILFAGVVMLLLMTGCPYESSVPLGDSCNSATDPQLAGKWFYPASGNKRDTLEILPFSDHEYLVVAYSNGNAGIPREDIARVFISKVGGVKFINFRSIGNNEKWVLVKYQITGNMLITWPASDQFIKQSFSTSREIVAYFGKNMDREGFFELPDTAYRLPEQKK